MTSIGCVSLLYATVGQAGGTAFLAVMTFADIPANEMRPTVLTLNIIAAGYATLRLSHAGIIDRMLLLQVTAPSLVTAFLGGLLVLGGSVYFMLTGILLAAAAGLMVFRRAADTAKAGPVRHLPAALVGAGAGFVSGLVGVGGGVFLTPILIVFGCASPRRAVGLSPAFILCNSLVGMLGVLLAGQTPAPQGCSTLYTSE
jgi:uncharacterized membrane protein YfcA